MSILLDVLTDPVRSCSLVEDLRAASDRPSHGLDDLGDVALLDELFVVQHRHRVGEVIAAGILPVPQRGGVAR